MKALKICPNCETSVYNFHSVSHTIPKFLLSSLRKSHPKYQMLQISFQSRSRAIVQDGIKSSFWCKTCETVSGHLDRNAAKILRSSPTFLSREEVAILRCFALDVLLREHYRLSLEKGVQLIPERHFAKIRKARSNLNFVNYPTVVLRYREDDLGRFHVGYPTKLRDGAHRFIKFSGGGYCFITYVSSHKKPRYVEEHQLNGASMEIPIMPENTGERIQSSLID